MTAALKSSTASRGGPNLRGRLLIGVVVAAGVLLVLANVHLVYVAVSSQPECVVHRAAKGAMVVPFKAAKPAC